MSEATRQWATTFVLSIIAALVLLGAASLLPDDPLDGAVEHCAALCSDAGASGWVVGSNGADCTCLSSPEPDGEVCGGIRRALVTDDPEGPAGACSTDASDSPVGGVVDIAWSFALGGAFGSLLAAVVIDVRRIRRGGV